MTGKFVFLLAVLVAIAGIASGDGTRPTRNDLIVGAHTGYDYPIVRQTVRKVNHYPYGWIEFQQTFYTLDERSIITLVRAQSSNDNGTSVSVLGGGPGANNVTLLFKSQMDFDLYCIVEIWAEWIDQDRHL